MCDEATFLIGLTTGDSSPVKLSLEAVDARRFSPPPPPPTTVESAEHEALARIRSVLRLREPFTPGPLGPAIDVEAVALEDKFPNTRLVVYLRFISHPARLFARSTRLWDASGTFNSDYYLAVTVNLQETLHACKSGLPTTHSPDVTGVVWI